jgi:uncharacterized protein
MAERIVSPGVFTREIDQSFLPAGVSAIGAAIIGPTSKGPAGIPTRVTSYSEYVNVFGDVVESGSGASADRYKYMTSYAVQEYLKYADSVLVTRILAGTPTVASSNVVSATGGSSHSFKLYTLSEGNVLNSGGSAASTAGSGSAADETTNSALVSVSGSANNYRWEVSNVNTTKGTFSLSIRRGDDTINRKSVLEQYNNVTLDPNSNNYIAKVIGDQVYTVRDSSTTSPFLQLSGSFPNKSKLVRVEVLQTTLNYLDANGVIRLNALSSSLPQAVSGTFSGGTDGTVQHPIAWYDDIANTNTQGFNLANAGDGKTAYETAINLLANQDEYDFNLLVLPGLVDNYSNHATVLTKALNMVQDRGDAFLVIDPVEYGASLSTAKTKADSRDSSYAGMYWPWVQIPDTDLGKNVWVPASTLIPGVFAFNDRTAAEWFAPAGFNRGGIDIAIQAERKLTHSNRDDLYDSNVNPIATFPNSGVVVFGQKTLQKKASALDRINVRRLLIAAKKFIASSSKFLVFEQNTSETRNRFLNIANPYFENVQQRQGLYAFKVVMDDTNNTADVIDRNELRGQIFLQPTKTAEFIVIDFNVLPTGASFPE